MDYTFVSTVVIAIVQTAAIVIGHVAGVVAAHDRSLALLKRGRARRGQYPMLTVMIGYTVFGIALIAGA